MAVEGEMVRVRNAVKTCVLNTSESKVAMWKGESTVVDGVLKAVSY